MVLSVAEQLAFIAESENNGGSNELMKFPSNFDDEKTMWVKYNIFEVVSGNASTRTLRPGVSENSKGLIALSLPSDGLSISDKQKWSTETATDKDKMMGGNYWNQFVSGAGQYLGSAISSASSTTAVVDKMALKYSGPEIRSFTTKHKMVPRNLNESQKIQAIIKKFRTSSAPLIKDQDAGIVYELPDFFKVTYMEGSEASNKFPQHNTCYCSSVDVTYSRTTFQDNYPTEVELTLSFTELDPIDSVDIAGGY